MKKIISCLLLSLSAVCYAQESTEDRALSNEDRKCLVDAIYHEARGEPEKGMFAVASVVIARTEHPKFPDSVCSVVKQKGQFTFNHQAKKTEKNALNKVNSIVDAIESGFEAPLHFLYFHRFDVQGQCSSKKNRVKIGSHYFCR